MLCFNAIFQTANRAISGPTLTMNSFQHTHRR